MRIEKASINFTELEAFRMTLPVDQRDEKFRFMKWRWDIVKAQFLILLTGKKPGKLEKNLVSYMFLLQSDGLGCISHPRILTLNEP
jgi:hypothetical protein